MPQYDQYAHVYDASGQLGFSLSMLEHLQELLERHPVPCKTVVDLACGTGTMAIGLAKAGWQVQGIDLSAQMLNQARAKAATAGVPVSWSQQDMRHFAIDRSVCLVTCLYDSMNYMLNDEDLAQAFKSVHAALQPGGLFVFDMNTQWAFAELWDQENFVTQTDDFTVIMACRFDVTQQRGLITMTCFEREGQLYRKIVEEHVEQAYPPEHVATLLADARLHLEAMYTCLTFDAPDDETGRILFIARRAP